MPNRTWLTGNSGQLLDPSLAGYQPSYTFNENEDRLLLTPDQASGKMDELPPHHVNWRWKGIGMVVDFGWKRTEEGIQWEKAPAREERVEVEPAKAITPRTGFWRGLVQNVRQGSPRWTEL